MKLTTVLASVNDNPKYYKFIPMQIYFWAKFNIKFIAIFVGNEIPIDLINYKDNIILWNKNLNIHTAYVAQNIRIYYTALLNLPDDEMVMITDMDMLPTNDIYYKSELENFNKQDFIYYRHFDEGQIYICYNAAHSSIWAKIFNIYSIDDIENELNNNFNPIYSGIPGKDEWYRDQEILTSKLLKYDNLKILKRPIKRLEIDTYINHLKLGDKYFIKNYDDVHFHRDYDSNEELIYNALGQL